MRPTLLPPIVLSVVAIGVAASALGSAHTTDLHFFWLAGRLLAAGKDPYDAGVWEQAMRADFVGLEQDFRAPFPGDFIYPLWTGIAFIPLGLLPLRAAAAIWSAVVIGGTIWGSSLALRSLGATARSRDLLATLALAAQPFWLTLITAQFGGLTLLLAGTHAFALAKGHGTRAGVTLAALAIKPHVVLLAIPLAFGEAVARRRRPAVVATLATVGVMAIVSVALVPRWPFELVGKLSPRSTEGGMPNLAGLGEALGVAGLIVPLYVVVIAALLVVLWRSPRSAFDVLAVGVTGSLLLTPYSGSHDHLLLAIPWARILDVGERATRRDGSLLRIGLVVVAVLLPWNFYAVAIAGRPNDALNALVPLATLVLLGAAHAVDRARAAGGAAELGALT